MSETAEHDAAIVRLEEKVMFLEERVATLDAALTRESRENGRLVERIELVERALQTLAARSAPRRPEDVAGAFTVDDPVPHSG